MAKPIQIDTFKAYQYLSEATLSADGRRCVYVQTKATRKAPGMSTI